MKPPPVQTPTPCFDENIALALIDGQLAMPQRHAALTHAEGCDACRLLLRELAAPTQDSIQPSTPPSTPPSIGVWELLEEVGRGSAGTVHRARHRDSGLLAAVKLVNDAQLRARFEREARALASLSYPGIVRYYEHGVLPNGTMFLVMQWLEGPTLEARLESGPRLNAHEVVELGVRLAYALGHAHGRGCVHRDLSPKNVILHEGKLEGAMIVDFGLVRWVNPAPALTQSRAIVGTPYYMAPEQIRGEFDIDARADLFALGVLLFVAASGKRPFDGTELFDVWQRIVHTSHPDLTRLAPHMPRDFVDVVNHLLEKAPADRPISAEQVARKLSEVRFEPPPSALRTMLPWMALAIVVTGATATIAFLLQRDTVQELHFSRAKDGEEPEPTSEPEPEPEPAPPQQLSPPSRDRPRLEDEDETVAAPTIAPRQPPPGKPLTAVQCGRGRVLRGGTYVSTDPSANAVTVMKGFGGCTLEDCTVWGSSVILGGELTLRHCTITGAIRMGTGARLRVEHTPLAEPPFVLNGALHETRRGDTLVYTAK